jgi:hypothetical protein
VLKLVKPSRLLATEQSWLNRIRCVDRQIGFDTNDGFISPNGKHAGTITNLAAFCRRQGLSNSHMIALAHRRIASHRGWTHKDGRTALTPKKHGGFIRPDGRSTVIINLARFCRENGLSVVHMHNLKSGIRKRHKGWTWSRG